MSYAQTGRDTLNRMNENNKRTGYWIVYLTDRLIPVRSKSQACFYAYDYYDNGVRVGFFPIADNVRKSARRIDYHGLIPVKGKITLLSGNITFFDKDSVSIDEYYLNGVPVLRQGYFWDKAKKCRYKQTLNYDHEYKGETGSFYYEYFDYQDSVKGYNEDALIEKIWYRKKFRTWKLHYEKPEPSEEVIPGKIRYNILPLDRNGKGVSVLNTIRRSTDIKLDAGFGSTYIRDQWLSGIHLDATIAISGRVGVGYSYCYLYGNSPKDYGYYREKRMGLFEHNTVFHYFMIYNRKIKSSFTITSGYSYFNLLYSKNDHRAYATSAYYNFKPGIWATFRIIKGLQLNIQAYYRWVYDGNPTFTSDKNLKGFGYSICLSFM